MHIPQKMLTSSTSRCLGYARYNTVATILVIACCSGQVDAWVPASFSSTAAVTAVGRSSKHFMAASSCWAEEQGAELIDRFGAVWEPQIEKVIAYENLQVSASKDRILDAALDYIHKTGQSTPRILAQKRWIIRLPSRRITVACFGRILAEMNAGRITIHNEGIVNVDESLDLPPDEHERQNLNHLLKLLSTHDKGIWGIEGEMIQTAGIKRFGRDFGSLKQTN